MNERTHARTSSGVDVFTDYLQQLPGVTAGGSGPGQNTIYIRGLASTTPNLTTAGVAGLAPNVAFYLDEQPLGQPGRNLDVYAADIARVEVLPGPQGTLYGASSQAGTVRMITNEPVIGEFEASRKLWRPPSPRGGEMSNNVEAVVNLPVAENFALRGVVYVDSQGGYIDNVAGTRSARRSARVPRRRHGALQWRSGECQPRRLPGRGGSDRCHLPRRRQCRHGRGRLQRHDLSGLPRQRPVGLQFGLQPARHAHAAELDIRRRLLLRPDARRPGNPAL